MINTFIPLSNYGFIAVTGPDARTYLQGQLTCDMNQVTRLATFACLCNVQGRVQALLRIFEYSEGFIIRLPHELIPLALARLKKYAMFSKVSFQDVSEQWKALGIQTSNLAEIEQFDYFSKLSDGLYEVYTKNTSPLAGEVHPSKLCEKGASEGYNNIQPFTYERIKQKIPEIYLASYEKFLPHPLNLHELGAISFNKGCYTGQEIIARMHYRGTLKQHLQIATIDADTYLSNRPTPNMDIFNEEGNVVGQLVDSAYAVDNKNPQALLLILLRDDAAHERIRLGETRLVGMIGIEPTTTTVSR
jgi:folate-binding protein YgfZ